MIICTYRNCKEEDHQPPNSHRFYGQSTVMIIQTLANIAAGQNKKLSNIFVGSSHWDILLQQVRDRVAELTFANPAYITMYPLGYPIKIQCDPTMSTEFIRVPGFEMPPPLTYEQRQAEAEKPWHP